MKKVFPFLMVICDGDKNGSGGASPDAGLNTSYSWTGVFFVLVNKHPTLRGK